jgi:tetratricopeptide (TPR) repeat protein
MATYNKRGYKAPKEKVEDVKLDNDYIEKDIKVDENDSATAKAFDTLDQTASRTEEWVARNQKLILGVLGAIVLVTIGYLLYQRFVVKPTEEDATNDIFVTQQNFQAALDAQEPKKQDSLFNLVLKGSEGKQGAVGIADQYSSTDAGNLANYYAGIANLNLKKYDEAIKYLEKFSSKDRFLGAIATGAIGDAYSQKNDAQKALDFYEKAARQDQNDLTTPRYLLKAGQVALQMGKKDEAVKYFTEIKEKFDQSQEAQNIDALIGMAQ